MSSSGSGWFRRSPRSSDIRSVISTQDMKALCRHAGTVLHGPTSPYLKNPPCPNGKRGSCRDQLGRRKVPDAYRVAADNYPFPLTLKRQRNYSRDVMSRAEHASASASIVWHDLDGVRYVVASGEIDLSNAPDLSVALEAPELVVDMTKVTFLDSTGLATLVKAHNFADSFELTVSRTVRRLLEITGLQGMLTSDDEIGSLPTTG